jgi:hypothetical protein
MAGGDDETAVAPMRGERRIDDAGIFNGRPGHNREILFFHFPFEKLAADEPLRFGAFGQQQYAAGVLIETMNNSRNVPTVGHLLDHAIAPIAPGNGGQSRRFGDSEKVCVFPEDLQHGSACLQKFPSLQNLRQADAVKIILPSSFTT